MQQTFGSVLDETRGIGRGFDFLRIALSFSILAWHSIVISYGFETEAAVWQTPLGTLAAALLPVFFALSGFLVMGSALRVGSLSTFLGFRMLRILPALTTEVVFGAVLVGGLTTTLSFHDYFLSAGFFRYLQNIVGHISFFLPGVFQANPEDTVNASLWTIPPEIFCYLFIALMILSGGYRNRGVYAAVALLLVAVNLVADKAFAEQSGPSAAGVLHQYHLFLGFVLGNMFYLWRYHIPRRFWLFALSAVASFLLLQAPGYTNVALVTLTYCIVYLGTAALPTLPLLSRGDYSYGVYLYGYPMQQLVTMLFPGWRVWWFNVLLALPLSLLLAMFSWHVIEKPALRLKDRLKPLRAVEAAWLGAYPVRLVLSLLFSAYGVVLLHWSNLDASTGFSFRAHWPVVAAASLAVGVLAAGLPRGIARRGASLIPLNVQEAPVSSAPERGGPR
jgi:peptidoglycan/LPS O-acetylase OafA/YrhL